VASYITVPLRSSAKVLWRRFPGKDALGVGQIVYAVVFVGKIL
jgi:hypothetical protein